RINLLSPFVLRSVDPPIPSIHGRVIRGVRRVGKRIVFAFEPSSSAPDTDDREPLLVLHLMIAGRLRWREPGQKPGMGPKMLLASFDFAHGTLFFTEASSKN